jgi:hypothetical protein
MSAREALRPASKEVPRRPSPSLVRDVGAKKLYENLTAAEKDELLKTLFVRFGLVLDSGAPSGSSTDGSAPVPAPPRASGRKKE